MGSLSTQGNRKEDDETDEVKAAEDVSVGVSDDELETFHVIPLSGSSSV